MEINDFVKQKGEGEFLKADQVVLKNPNAVFEISGEATLEHNEKYDIATIVLQYLDVATLEHNEKYDTDRLYIPLKYGEVEYIFDCSRTNARTITQKLGADTKKWIGRTLLLETYKTKTSDGKMVDAINVKDVK